MVLKSYDEILAHVASSGGLFTYESLSRLSNKDHDYPSMKLSGYSSTPDENMEEKIAEFWAWALEKWDEYHSEIDEWDMTRFRSYWAIDFLTKIGFDPSYQRKNESVGEAGSSLSFHISHRGWRSKTAPRIHIIHPKESFDSKASDRNKNSPHESMQRYLILNNDVRWGILFNGRSIRLLREYYHIYTRGYVEFDIENIIAERSFNEFRLMYQMLHASRFRPDSTGKAPIDDFFDQSTASGVKIGELLRNNVQQALELLGNALLSDNLRKHFLSDIENVESYYAELLRVIYRIVFILYAEQRGMLPKGDTLYGKEYSLTQLRTLAEQPIIADKEIDLWRGLQRTFQIVGEGIPGLGVAGYDGELFDLTRTSTLNDLDCSNENLLMIIRLLTTTENKGVRERISFLDLDVEEMGAVYESLLDYRPRILTQDMKINGNHYRKGQFALLPQSAQRKSTGSYYTHKSLVNVLVQSALVPVVEKKLSAAKKKVGKNVSDRREAMVEALLEINICDPACGSGAFLLAAMDYLGFELAKLEINSENPSERELREARRKVLQRCIYGVDKNPLSVELAKMSLWLHAFVENLPLNFLDHHIKVGDSLVGCDEQLLEQGIPTSAFLALTGQKSTGIESENATALNEMRKQLKLYEDEGSTITVLAEFDEKKEKKDIASELNHLEGMPELTILDVHSKATLYSELSRDYYHSGKLLAHDIWTSAFFWPITKESRTVFPNNGTIREALVGQVNAKLKDRVDSLSSELKFFHWILEFPEVFNSSSGGFDCILTNPPWETLQMKENEFFAGLAPSVENAATQAERRKEIFKLANSKPELHSRYTKAWQSLKRIDHFYRESGVYPLSARGTINTYALFVERCWNLLSKDGLLGTIVPSGIATSYYMQDFFKEMVERESLVSFFDFENRKGLFDIHRMYRFCLLILSGGGFKQKKIPMTFYLHDPDDIQDELISTHLVGEKEEQSPSEGRVIRLVQDDFRTMNPNTLTAPLFRTRRDYEITKKIYEEVPILIERNSETGEVLNNPWNISFLSCFHMSGDSEHFANVRETDGHPVDDRTPGGPWIVDGKKYVPLYEGKMIWFYDHRYNSVEETGGQQGTGRETTEEEHRNPYFAPMPRHWVSEEEFENRVPSWYNRKWFLSYRNITNATNERTIVSTIIPRSATDHALPLFLSNSSPRLLCGLLANLSSMVLDYVARQKIPGTNASYYLIEQLPILEPDKYPVNLLNEICKRVVELIYTSINLNDFAVDCNYNKQISIWNPIKRKNLMAELDAIYAHLYKLDRGDYEYILSTFRIHFPNQDDYQFYLKKYEEMESLVGVKK